MFGELEIKWAEDMMTEFNLEELSDYIAGAPSPAYSLALNCRIEHLPKLLSSVVFILNDTDWAVMEELISTLILGVECREKFGAEDGIVDSAQAKFLQEIVLCLNKLLKITSDQRAIFEPEEPDVAVI
jgi:hypothetical protein